MTPAREAIAGRARLPPGRPAPPSGPGSAAAPPPGDRGVVLIGAAMGLVGAAMAAAALPGLPALDPTALLLLVGLVVLARLATLTLYDRGTYSVSTLPVLAAGMLLGVSGAVAVAFVSGIANALVRRPPWYKALFNCGNFVLAAALAAWFFHAAGAQLTTDRLPTLLLIAAATGLVHYTHMLLTAVAIAVEHRTSPLSAWNEHFAWLWPQYVILGVLAALLALAYQQFGLAGATAFVAPPALMLYTAKQYVDHTTASVRQLRELNDELRATNARLLDEMHQRSEAESEAARLAKEAARAAALEELSQLKSRFVSIASHELRTPLTTLAGYTELALIDTPADDPRHDMLERAYRSANLLAKLIDDLLDASRIETGRMIVEPAEVDLAAAIPAAVEPLASGAPRHRLESSVAPEARWVRTDPERLQQVLSNLVGNAIKYSPAGGQVLVSAAPSVRPGHVDISVADEGLGIPADQIESIFDPYQRVRSAETRRIRGTGLGLYIVRHLVELQGGSVGVKSEVGRGSTFTVTLPAAAAEATT